MFTNDQIDEFAQAYAMAALWSSVGDDGELLDDCHGVDDIAPECMAAMRKSCADFIGSNKADMQAYCERMKSEEWTGMQRAGHDFWLTRCGHGTGFWDHGLGELGERLSDAASVYGNVELYVGDDGLIYGE